MLLGFDFVWEKRLEVELLYLIWIASLELRMFKTPAHMHSRATYTVEF